MKSLLLFCAIAGSLRAESEAAAATGAKMRVPKQLQPPRLPPAMFRSQRFEIVPTTESSAEPTTNSAVGPYPPSGWKPAGASFLLPNEQAAASGPYSPSGWTPTGKPFLLPQERQPSTSYGTPDDVYGVPDDTTGATTTDVPTTNIPETIQAEKIEGPVEVLKSVGTYYVLLPGGRLQQVRVVADGAGVPARLQLGRRAPQQSFGR